MNRHVLDLCVVMPGDGMPRDRVVKVGVIRQEVEESDQGAWPISVDIPYTSVNKSDTYYSWFLAARALGKSIYKIMHACIQDDDPPALRRAKGSGSEGRRGPREKPRTPTLPGRGRRCPRRIRPPEPRGPCELLRLGDDESRRGPVLRYVPRIRCRPDGCAKPGPPPVRTAVDAGVRLR